MSENILFKFFVYNCLFQLGELFEVSSMENSDYLWPRPLSTNNRIKRILDARPVFEAYVRKSMNLKVRELVISFKKESKYLRACAKRCRELAKSRSWAFWRQPFCCKEAPRPMLRQLQREDLDCNSLIKW